MDEITIFKVTIEAINNEQTKTIELIERTEISTLEVDKNDELIDTKITKFAILEDLNLIYEFKDKERAIEIFEQQITEALESYVI